MQLVMATGLFDVTCHYFEKRSFFTYSVLYRHRVFASLNVVMHVVRKVGECIDDASLSRLPDVYVHFVK